LTRIGTKQSGSKPSQYDTILTTPQLFLDVLNAKYVSLSIFSTLVVNECQHCSGRHPLSLIFSNYYVKLDPSTVRVLGLSRRLVKHNVSESNAKSVIQKLESVMRSSVINWEAEIVRCNELANAIV
jgi:ERCC4-related helicase